ncbi:MAG TPA: hypothetical protein VFS47_06225 [Steroidobacteraceae bacterium]|nr:hypothetical protein [Steroidobacteraceae bacterium]
MIAVWIRAGVVLIIIAVHIALLLLLAYRQRREGERESSMQLVLIPHRSWPEVPTPEPEPGPLRSQQDKPIRAKQNPVAAPVQESQPAAPSIDWHASGAAAASGAVARQLKEEGYRNFGFPKHDRVEPTAPSIFKEPKHKAGDVETDSLNGITRVYHSEHCFTELEFRTLEPFGLPGSGPPNPSVNLPRCMFPAGKPEPDGDLFKHLKKDRPLPELKPGTQPGPLPERIEPKTP